MENQTPTVTPTPPAAEPQSKKKLLTIVGAIVAVIVVAIIGYLGFQMFSGKSSYQFTINGYAVPEAEFQEVYEYYQAQADQGEDPLTQTQNIFIENYILNSEYIAQGNTEDQLAQAVASAPPPASEDLPPTLVILNSENNIMKESILPGIGITSVSGQVFQLSATSSAEAELTQDFMNTTLQGYKDRFDAGETIEELSSGFAQDPTLIARTDITRDVKEFENMSPSLPLIPVPEFSEQAFSTPAQQMSQVFSATTRNGFFSGIVYISANNGGTVEGYNNWLSEKRQGVTVVFVQ